MNLTLYNEMQSEMAAAVMNGDRLVKQLDVENPLNLLFIMFPSLV